MRYFFAFTLVCITFLKTTVGNAQTADLNHLKQSFSTKQKANQKEIQVRHKSDSLFNVNEQNRKDDSLRSLPSYDLGAQSNAQLQTFSIQSQSSTSIQGNENLGFENGFSGWSGSLSYNLKKCAGSNTRLSISSLDQTGTVRYPPFNTQSLWDTNPIVLGNSLPIQPARHALLTNKDLVDEYGGFKIFDNDISTLGNVIARIGNGTIGSCGDGDKTFNKFLYEQESMSYTFLVGQNDKYLYINYAVVLNEPTNGFHDVFDRTYFSITVKNQSNTVIACSNLDVYANSSVSNIPGFVKSTVEPWNTDPNETDIKKRRSVVYKPWSVALVDLTSYIGTTVTLNFATGDCLSGGHWAYAYVNAYTSTVGIITAKNDATASEVFCSGEPVAFSSAFTGRFDDETYLWNFGDGTAGSSNTQQSPIHTYTNGGTYTVTLQVTSRQIFGSCPISKTITIMPPTTPPAGGTSSTRCGSGTVTLSASSTAPGTFRWYTALTGGTAVQTSAANLTTSSYTTPLISATTAYYVTVANAAGCESTPRTLVNATVNAVPSLPTATEGSRCGSGTVTLSASSTAPGTFRWYTTLTDGTAVQTSAAGQTTNSFTTPTISATTSFYVTFAIASGCESTPRTLVNATVKTVSETVTFETHQYLCATLFIPSINFTSAICTAISYQWNFGDGTTSTEQRPMHVFPGAGTYATSLKLTYQCNGCTGEANASKQITFSPTNTTIEDRLIEAETDIKNQVIKSSAATFSDSWSLPHDNAGLSNKSSYLNGTQGVWRNNASYVYNVPRQLSPTTNLAKDGTYTLNQFDWGSAEFNVVPNWIQANTMTQYSPYSYELENKDVLGVYSAALYDYGGHLPSANGVNMRNAEMAFTSFEVSDGKPSGNWMLSNAATPASATYKVPIARDYIVVVEAPLQDFDLVNKVDVNAESFWFGFFFRPNTKPTNFLQDVEVLCKQQHPTNPNWSVLVLGRAPFDGFWYGKITVKKEAARQNEAMLDGTKAHSGKSSMKVMADFTLRQELFELEEGKSYWVNAWVTVENGNQVTTPKLADNLGIEITLKNKQGQVAGTVSFQPIGTIIEGWQQVKGTFTSPIKNPRIEIKFKAGSKGKAWYDDLRLQPEKGNMKAYVYNLEDYRLQAILDEENYASFFYYDKEGNLYLTKKETERGIKTITENVSYQVER